MSHTPYPDFHFEDVALLTDIAISRDFSSRRKEGVKAAWCLAGHIAGRTVGEPEGTGPDDGEVITFHKAEETMSEEQLTLLHDLLRAAESANPAIEIKTFAMAQAPTGIPISVLFQIAKFVLPWIIEQLLSDTNA